MRLKQGWRKRSTLRSTGTYGEFREDAGESLYHEMEDAENLQVGVEFHVVFLEAFANPTKGVVHRMGELQHFVLILIDHAPAHHGAEVQHFIPIFAAVNDD